MTAAEKAILLLDTVLFAGFTVCVDGADVEAEVFAGAGHRPGVHGGVVAEVMGQIALFQYVFYDNIQA